MPQQQNRTYLAIDLKSFYASVECVERGLDPLTAHLVVADESRTEKTICLAVSPALKAYGISGRARLFEVIEAVKRVNAQRRKNAPGHEFTGEDTDAVSLAAHPEHSLGYTVAVPRMSLYMKRSTDIYKIYLKYISPEDIHVYSIDEVFIDATCYLTSQGITARELAQTIIRDILQTTGITATCGIGTNLYLCKVAMDIVAKHSPADENGVRIAELDEMSYRRTLWDHRPLTDFWRVGRGYEQRLAAEGIYTMGDIARCSVGAKGGFRSEDTLYRLFGVNAELLIDHAWGWEPCTIAEIHAYRPESSSISSGQVLHEPTAHDTARLIAWEMTDLMALDLVDKRLVTDQLVLTVGYDRENLEDPQRRAQYDGPVTKDFYGRSVPKHAHGSVKLPAPTSSARELTEALLALYDKTVNPNLLVRRITIAANHVVSESNAAAQPDYEQTDLFTDYGAEQRKRQQAEAEREKERRLQEAALAIRKKYGKNALLKGRNLQEGATARDRNSQIGGHKA